MSTRTGRASADVVAFTYSPEAGYFLSHLVVGFDGESLVVEEVDDFNLDCGVPHILASASV